MFSVSSQSMMSLQTSPQHPISKLAPYVEKDEITKMNSKGDRTTDQFLAKLLHVKVLKELAPGYISLTLKNFEKFYAVLGTYYKNSNVVFLGPELFATLFELSSSNEWEEQKGIISKAFHDHPQAGIFIAPNAANKMFVLLNRFQGQIMRVHC